MNGVWKGHGRETSRQLKAIKDFPFMIHTQHHCSSKERLIKQLCLIKQPCLLTAGYTSPKMIRPEATQGNDKNLLLKDNKALISSQKIFTSSSKGESRAVASRPENYTRLCWKQTCIYAVCNRRDELPW